MRSDLAKVFEEANISSEEIANANSDKNERGNQGLLGYLSNGQRAIGLSTFCPPESASLWQSKTGTVLGTIPYMAPEQFDDSKHIDVKADVYSFGVMLFQMITGQLPFTGRSVQEFEHKHKTEPPPLLASHNAELNRVVQKCLAKNPNNRFSSFDEVRRELAEIYQRISGNSAPEPVSEGEFGAIELGNKGVSLLALGRFDEAIACWDKLLEIDPLNQSSMAQQRGCFGQAEQGRRIINMS